MALQEAPTQTNNNYEAQLAVARGKLAGRGIVRLAVLGPEGSDGEQLARDLGVEGIEHHGTYKDVLAASTDPKIASVLPYANRAGEAIMHDEEGKTTNLSAILKSARSLIAHLEQPVGDDVLITKIVTKS